MSDPTGDTPDTSDRSLLVRLRRGEESAATALYLRYARRLLALAQARTSSDLAAKEEADDIVQSVFKSFFRKASAGLYDVPEGEELWNLLLVITINKIRAKGNYHRAAKRDMRLAAGEQPLEAVAADEGGNDAALTELRMVIDEILKGLPEKSAEIVELRIAGNEVNDIVARVRRSKRTVERVLQDFRERLRTKIDGAGSS
jgi:RNA polymerase sigma-70 factor, ECF subfamily